MDAWLVARGNKILNNFLYIDKQALCVKILFNIANRNENQTERDMLNIFNGIRCMSDDELKTEIALLKKINLINAAKSFGNKALGTVADIANSFIRSFSKDSIWDYEVVEITDMVRQEYEALSNLSRPMLLSQLKHQLAVKCGIAEEEADNVSEIRLSFMLCNEAAKLYNIEKYSTIANKIEQVSIQYNTDFYTALHAKLISQDKAASEIWDRKLQKRLDAIPIEDKRELQKKLFPKEFSGKGIGRIFREERGTKYLAQALPIIGLEGFDYISAYVGAAIHSVKSLTRISQSVMAQLIWRAVSICPLAFKADISILPSYIAMEQRNEADANELQFRQLLKKRVAVDKELTQLKNVINKNEEQIAELNEKIEASQKELDTLQNTFQKLEKQKAEFTSGKHNEYDTKRYYSDVNETNRKITAYEAGISKQERKRIELTKKHEALEGSAKEKKAEALEIRKQTDMGLAQLAEKVKASWNRVFTDFTFADEIYGLVSVAFTREEMLKLEEMLYEIMQNGDIDAYDSKEGMILCAVEKNMTAKIYHEGRHITAIERQI